MLPALWTGWLTTGVGSIPLLLKHAPCLTACQRTSQSDLGTSHSITAGRPHLYQLAWAQHRALSAGNPKGFLTLKSALRQLYKRVHPDLFSDYPAEQAENERSFKLLQDYLHQARNPTVGPASRVAYHFRFFLTPQHTGTGAWPDSDGELSDDSAAVDSPQFEMVQLVLVPPPPPARPHSADGSSSSSSKQPMSAGARQGLAKLLKLCGLGDIDAEEEGEDAALPAAARLTTFLPEAAEVVRQHESGPAKHEVRVANMRAAFRLARGVIAGFQPGAFTGAQQVDHLQRLADAFDLLSDDDPPDLAGLHILICDRTSLDSQGTLCLDAAADVDEWAAFLGGVDPDYAREKKASAAALRGLESQVAAALGVRMLFTAAPYLMTHEYRSFLERMAAHAAEHGPVKTNSDTHSSSSTAPKVGASSIPVYVAPTYQLAEDHRQRAVHESVGYIQVPMQASAQEVYEVIQANAPSALAILASKAADQSELAELTTSVRTRLNLRRFTKDELISMQDFRNACKRLLLNRDVLQRCHIEGLSLRVSDTNRVAPDGSLVDIAWDFDV